MSIMDNININKIKLIITCLILGFILISDTYINGMKISEFIMGLLTGASVAPLVFTAYHLLRTSSVMVIYSLIFNKSKVKYNKGKDVKVNDIDDTIDNINEIDEIDDIDNIDNSTPDKVYQSNLEDIDTGNYNKDLSNKLSPLINFIVMLPSFTLKLNMRLVLIRVSLTFMIIAGLFMCFNLVAYNQFNMMSLATTIILSCLNIIINLYQIFDSN